MRFLSSVLVAALLDLVVLLRVDDWRGSAALLAIGYLLVASAGAAFFAGARPALAGSLAVLLGVLMSGLVQYWPRVSYANDLGVLLEFELQLVTAFIPYAIAGAVAGLVAGGLRSRLVRA